MKKNKTRTSVLQTSSSSVCLKLILFSCLSVFNVLNVNAQCDLACNNNILVALDEDCYKVVEPDDILEGTYEPICEPFTVVVAATGGNFVTGDQIGQTVSVSVYAANNNYCWGTITVVDQLPPVINCQTVTITCLDDPDDVAPPTVTDNCDDPDLTVVENIVENGCFGQYYKVITRTYTAVDNSGNSTTCDQIINVTRPGLNQVVFPQNYDDIQQPALDCVNPNTNPSNTGVPTINGEPINNVCSFGVSYNDQQTTICQNSYSITRQWTVNDWCTSQTINHNQIIKVLDKTAPTLNCQNSIQISTGNDDCFGSLIIPNPTVNDNCSTNNNIDIIFSASAGNISGNLLYNLPIGNHTLTFTATDDCGNSQSCTTNLSVIDDVAPLAACETNHTVNLSNSTPSLVEAQVFDNGSHDLCGNVTFLVRRMDASHCPGNDATNFSAFVPFYCCDVGNTVIVELQVTDQNGNINSCMVVTAVQDVINPTISCPPNITLDCSDDYTNLNLTGQATANDNCGATVSHFDFVDIDNCGGGQVVRTWTAIDESGNTASCTQIISVVNSTPFNITDTNCSNSNPNDGVIWPCDYDTNSCGPGLDPSVTGEPQIIEDLCDLVGVSYEDVVLPITPPACLKVIRTWTVVDWCLYNGNPAVGYWEYVQTIKVLNSDDPVILTDCEDKAFCSYDENCEEGPADLLLEANDDCTDSLDLVYNYWIDLDNDGSDDISGNTNDASGTYPLGTHKIRWNVEDGCGNVSICEYLFIISDCKAPTPNVLDGIAVDLMEICQIEVWANDFDNPSSPSYDNCGIAQWLIQSPSEGPGQTTPPATAQSSWVFTDLNIGTNTVDIWIQDINGNWDYVSTSIVVQDNIAPFCDPIQGVNISGKITTEGTIPVQNVTVGIDFSPPGIPNPDIVTTDENGDYTFYGLPIGAGFTIAPEKNINPLNGVTTYDLVLLSKHILQIETLDSPYKIIAADANNSGSVSTLDMVELRKLILFVMPEFSNNTSWRFIHADFVFPNPINPFETAFPEVFSINNPVEDVIVNFIGVKIGDLNGSVNPSELQDPDSRNSNDPLVFEIAEQRIEAGKTYDIQIKSKTIKPLHGFQFTLRFDKNSLDFQQLETVELEALSTENFGFDHLDKRMITASWHHFQPQTLSDDQTIFTLRFTALKDARLSELLSITSDLTIAEAYNQNGEVLPVQLRFSSGSNNLDLFQNQPNPFYEFTTISFRMPETGEATISIFDVTGRMVKEIRQDFTTGFNEVTISKSDLRTGGVYYYQLKTSKGSMTKKMVHTGSKS